MDPQCKINVSEQIQLLLIHFPNDPEIVNAIMYNKYYLAGDQIIMIRKAQIEDLSKTVSIENFLNNFLVSR